MNYLKGMNVMIFFHKKKKEIEMKTEPEIKIEKTSQMADWYCPRCGSANSLEMRFCPQCGMVSPKKELLDSGLLKTEDDFFEERLNERKKKFLKCYGNKVNQDYTINVVIYKNQVISLVLKGWQSSWDALQILDGQYHIKGCDFVD